jgi:hypothetical protein
MSRSPNVLSSALSPSRSAASSASHTVTRASTRSRHHTDAAALPGEIPSFAHERLITYAGTEVAPGTQHELDHTLVSAETRWYRALNEHILIP